MRALTRFYGVRIPNPVLAGLVLSVETEELGISAGLQDRVVQTHQGLVYMDFDRALLDARGYGQYERIDPAGLPPLYVAYRTDLAEGSEVFHNDIRSRFNRGDSEVVEAMRYWAGLAEQARDIIESGRSEALGPLLDANFDRRRQIYLISEGNLAMVAAARSVGASAKFTGSGGAIVGAYRDEEMYRRLEEALRPSRAVVIRPALVPALEEDDAHP